MLLLASASPRRRALLAAAGIAATVCDPGGDGPPVAGSPARQVLAHARYKAAAVAARFPVATVLAADTLVALDGCAFGKPADRAAAAATLAQLAGREHEVWTGVVLRRPSGLLLARADRALVRFRAPAAADLAAYLDGDEWRDKAGAYALQGWAGRYATVAAGDPETVVGLSTATVAQFLAASCEAAGAH